MPRTVLASTGLPSESGALVRLVSQRLLDRTVLRARSMINRLFHLFGTRQGCEAADVDGDVRLVVTRVQHDVLMSRVSRKVHDKRLLKLIGAT